VTDVQTVRENVVPRGLSRLFSRLKAYHVTSWRRPGDYGGRWSSVFRDQRVRAHLDEADVISSRDAVHEGMHYPAIDLDLPVYLVPSSTPGHSHLYIDKQVTWDQYEKILWALAEAGIVEKPFYEAAQGAEATMLRLPWVKRTYPSRVP
jgi:hypothetical protein